MLRRSLFAAPLIFAATSARAQQWVPKQPIKILVGYAPGGTADIRLMANPSQLMAVYGWAWTSFFWFDDAVKLNALYADVERIALASDSADDLERLNNLSSLLIDAVRHGALDAESAAIDRR